MPNKGLSDGAVSFLRRIAVITGFIFIIVALLADRIGLSTGDGLSGNQIGISIAGLAIGGGGYLEGDSRPSTEVLRSCS
jgi:hypothetical protein